MNALSGIEKKYGIKMSLGNINYTETSFKASMSATTASDDVPVDNAKWKTDFVKAAAALGMKPTDFGRTVTSNGKLYTIAGARARKAELILKSTDKTAFYYAPVKLVSFV
jgi:hypothetical protein